MLIRYLEEIADIVPFFKGVTKRETWKIWSTMACKRGMEQIHKFYTQKHLNLEKED
jgi:hypothetical protein